MRKHQRYILSLLWLFYMPLVSHAQSLQITPRSLSESLRTLMAQSNISIVFSSNLVNGKSTSCRYQGSNPAEALTCILANTDFKAQKSASGQWIIVPKNLENKDLYKSEDIASSSPSKSANESFATLTGIVLEGEGNTPLCGATVKLLDTQQGAVANADGKFSISNLDEGEYQIQVSFVGYKSMIQTMHTNERNIVVHLSLAEQDSTPVIVDADATTPLRVQLTEGALSLSARQLAQQSAFQGQEDVFQILGNTANITRTSEMNGELIVRGADDGQNLYLVDNVPVYNPSRTFGQFSMFQTDLLQNVTLYKGSVPAAFGGRLSSVVSAELKDGLRDRTHITTGMSRYASRMMVESPMSQYASFMIAGRISLPDVLQSDSYIPIQHESGVQEIGANYAYHDVTAKLTLRPTKQHQVSFNFYRGDDSVGAKESQNTFGFLRADPNFAANSIQSRLANSWHSGYESMQYRYIYSPQLLVSATAYYTGYTNKETNTVFATDAAGALQLNSLSSAVGLYSVDFDEKGVKVETAYVAPHSDGQIGGSLVRYHFNSELQLALPSANQQKNSERLLTETAVYANNIVHLSKKFQIEPGIRIGAIDRYTFVLPQFSARYVPSNKLSVKFGVSTQAQHLHWLHDRYAEVLDPATGLWMGTGRLHIRPSHGMQASTGIETKPADGVKWDFDLYWRKSWNVLIAQNPYRLRTGLDQPILETGLNTELYAPGNNKGYGFETSLQLQRAKWQTQVNYSYGRSQNELPSNDEVVFFPARFDSPHAINALLRWNHPLFYAMLSGEMRTGYPTNSNLSITSEETTAAMVIQTNLNLTTRLRSYRRMDAVVGHNFRNPKIGGSLELQFFNLTNSQNILDESVGSGNRALELSGTRFTPSFNLKLSF